MYLLPRHLWEGTRRSVVDVTSVALVMVGWAGLQGAHHSGSVAILAQDLCGASSKRSTPALQIGSSWGVVVMAVLHGWPGFVFPWCFCVGPAAPRLAPFPGLWRSAAGLPADGRGSPWLPGYRPAALGRCVAGVGVWLCAGRRAGLGGWARTSASFVGVIVGCSTSPTPILFGPEPPQSTVELSPSRRLHLDFTRCRTTLVGLLGPDPQAHGFQC